MFSISFWNFFGTVEALYVFLEASTKRHAIFMNAQLDCNISRPVTLKHLSDIDGLAELTVLEH